MSADWFVAVIGIAAAAFLVGLEIGHVTGFRDGEAAANGLCRITCEARSLP